MSSLSDLRVGTSPQAKYIFSRQPGENFFDYACRIKQVPLNEQETEACRRFVNNIEQPFTPYLQTLSEIFLKHLALRMGEVEAPCNFIDRKVYRLMKIFLKDKLDLRKPLIPAHELAQRAQWDPHFHGSSLFADHFPVARLFLPNYEEAYTYMKDKHRALSDRFPLIREAMEAPSFPRITEVCVGNPDWDIEHAGKKFFLLFAHMRESGAVKHHDRPGYDMCGAEAEALYQPQAAFLQSIQGNKVVRMHMGETIFPSAGKAHVRFLLDEAEAYYKSSKPLRIGHSTHISIDDMLVVAKKGYYIEACLSSNKRTAIINKRSDYPLALMLLLGVNVVIGTDGGRLYSTTLAEEYAHAVRCLQKFHARLADSDQVVSLPNGDCLCYRHILPIIQEEKEGVAEWRSDKQVTYRELRDFVKPSALERVSVETLVHNANTLLRECYPSAFGQ